MKSLLKWSARWWISLNAKMPRRHYAAARATWHRPRNLHTSGAGLGKRLEEAICIYQRNGIASTASIRKMACLLGKNVCGGGDSRSPGGRAWGERPSIARQGANRG